jgi:hypothetical protein
MSDGWPDALTVAQLIERLAALPADAKVGATFDMDMGFGTVSAVRPGGGFDWKKDDPEWVTIIVDNQ